jgi:hypothetical protein
LVGSFLDDEVRKPMWLFVFLALAACGYYSWNSERAPDTPTGWLGYAGLAALAGVVFAAVDALLHGVRSMSIIFDLSLAVLAGIVALSGFVQSLVK